MSTTIPALLTLAATLAALWVLAGLLARHLQGLLLLLTGHAGTASAAYDVIVLPGVVLREVAHLVFATLLRVRVVRVDLFRFRREGDPRQGEVIVERVDPLRMSLVGAAPLLAGVPLTLLILRWIGVPPLGLTLEAIEALWTLLAAPRNWLLLYLLWAVANTMFPSAADRAAWWIVGLVAVMVAGLSIATGYSITLPPRLLQGLLDGAARLSSGLLPIVALDLVLLVLIAALERLAGRVTGRRVVRHGR